MQDGLREAGEVALTARALALVAPLLEQLPYPFDIRPDPAKRPGIFQIHSKEQRP